MPRRLCPRCLKPVKLPYFYHKECQELEAIEYCDRILALPEKPITDEDVRRFFAPDPTPYELQRKEGVQG